RLTIESIDELTLDLNCRYGETLNAASEATADDELEPVE
ncbi:MAG: hypothetical protein QG660_982, partial [Pseudomonadota bacterium]|nr:hypothetical protein [Pseudomonadota bacterium]